MKSVLPPNERLGPAIRAPRSHKTCVNVRIYGHKDPRGPDNNLRVWCDEDGKLHVRLEKTDRCYKFVECINTDGFVEIVAK